MVGVALLIWLEGVSGLVEIWFTSFGGIVAVDINGRTDGLTCKKVPGREWRGGSARRPKEEWEGLVSGTDDV